MLCVPFHAYHHLARFGELDRVAQQVDQDLSQPRDVADDGRRYVGGHLVGQLQPFLGSLDAQQVQRRFHALAQVEGLPFQLKLAGLDLGEVQDVVDDGEQGVAAVAHRLGEVALLGGRAVCRAAGRSCR